MIIDYNNADNPSAFIDEWIEQLRFAITEDLIRDLIGDRKEYMEWEMEARSIQAVNICCIVDM